MWAWVSAYSVSSVFLILLIGVPAVYYLLASDAHKDFSETLSNMYKNGILSDLSIAEDYHAGGKDMLGIFELEWWIIIAFAILISSILVSGYVIPANANLCINETGRTGECLDLKSGMALYAALIGLVVAFRLAWIRLSLLRYTTNFQFECVRQHLSPK